MNDKIKKALGDKAGEVEKLMKDAGIELAVENDGSFVPASKFDKLKADLEKANGEVTKYKDEINNVTNTKTKEAEEKANAEKSAKELAESIKKEFDDYKKSVESDKVKSKYKSAYEKRLKAEKANPDAIEFLLSSANYEKIIKEDGGVDDDYIEKLKSSKSSLFGVENSNSQQTTKTKTKEKPKYTIDQIQNMSQDEVTKNYKDVMASLEAQ